MPYIRTPEHSRHISEALTGRKRGPLSIEWRQRISAGLLGKTKGKRLTTEHRRKIGLAAKGRHYWLGKTRSVEDRQKMSLAKLGKKRGPHSEEHRRKISEAQKGARAPNWQGGITEQNRSLRIAVSHTLEYRLWRNDIYVRDDYTCQACFAKGGRLHAHHKKSFRIIALEHKLDSVRAALACQELWDRNNGLTLCKACHKAQHHCIVC